MIAASVVPLLAANGDPARAVALASALALLVGGIAAVGALARLGFVADLLSLPTMIGYMNGLALTILIGQLPKLFGFSVDADGLINEARAFADGLRNGETVGAALAVGVVALLLMEGLQRFSPRLPGVLIAVAVSIGLANGLDLEQHGVSVVGSLPQGFPPFTIPDIRLSDVPPLTAAAFGIVLVSLADTIATASAFAGRRGEDVDGNQEMLAVGAANIAAGLFQGFPVSTSGSRTAVATSAGSRSQMTGIVGAVAIVAMLVAVPGLLRDLPQATLGAVVISASLTLADIPGTLRLWRQSHAEFAVSIAAFLGVAILGVLPGIVVAVALSVANVFRRSWWPYQTELGRVAGIPGYHDVRSYPDAELVPGVVIFRFDAPLFFANANTFRDQIVRLASAAPRPQWIIVAAEPITDVDPTAADVLESVDKRINDLGVALVFAELKDPVRRKLERYELTKTIDPRHFFPTIAAAVAAFHAQSGAMEQSRAETVAT
jgi:high affinity sulfate transporter 1